MKKKMFLKLGEKMFLKLVGMLVITLVGMGGLTSLSYAIPSLQLYIPGSTYNPDTESWLTIEPHFELQVLGASSPKQADYITNLTLYVAMLKNEYGMDGAYVNINGSPITFSDYGIPIPSHGIYPTYYCAYSLPDLLVSTAGKTIWNYNPGEESESDTGDILSLNLDVSGYTFIHFDAAGTVVGKNGKIWERKVPFSHDADAPGAPVVPEPASILLLVPGLLGLAGLRRRKIHLPS